jgi:hypothetical protein
MWSVFAWRDERSPGENTPKIKVANFRVFAPLSEQVFLSFLFAFFLGPENTLFNM